MYEEMEAFKAKIESFQEQIRRGIDDVLFTKPTERTSVAAFCRLSEADRELHRQQAGNRLQELANNWDLSRITEASNASRARLSTSSLTGHMNRISFTNLSNVLDEMLDSPDMRVEDLMNHSFFLSDLPDVSPAQSQQPASAEVTDGMVGAAGDQAPVVPDLDETELVSPDVEMTEVEATAEPEVKAQVDELTNVQIEEKKGRKPAKSGKRKVTREPKVTEAKSTTRQVRKRKEPATASATGAASGDAARGTATEVQNPVTPGVDGQVSSGVTTSETKGLRPRRACRDINYKEK